MSSLRLPAADGPELEARWDTPESAATSAVVLCHPHPQQGGNMDVPLMAAVARRLVATGFAVLRFNYRGVGTSTGTWGDGHGELNDVTAAVAAARAELPDTAVGLAGWSFGAANTLQWLGTTHEALPWAGIAPPVSPALAPDLPGRDDLAASRRTFIIGDRDQFTSVAELTEYAATVGGKVEVLKGSDHFFYFREDRVAALVAEALVPQAN